MTRVFVCLLFVAIAFTSCDSSRYFEENKEIPKMEWDKDVPISFLVSVEDTSLGYNVYINVRNAGFYRFSNLYLFVNTTFPQGQVHRDTVECILASPEGRWLGEGLGDIWDNRILFKENVQFTQPGEYRFELNQAMRINPLPGIMDAGIRIEKVD
ncbi:MAG: gliding motility lipoprotein GldH [Bacteroidia bacterium]|nr:gliding motility lipoprotein GldH [Bacteroidia bacterium]